ncbi:hypothetical protein FQZ97_735180 [compost metagenome]
MLDVAELVEGITHQVVQGLFHQHRRTGSLGFQFVAGDIDLGLTQQPIHGGAQTLSTLAVLFSAILENPLGVVRQGAVILASNELVSLQVQTQLAGQVALVFQAQQHTALPLAGLKDAALLVPGVPVIHQGANCRNQQVAIHTATERMQIALAIEAKVFAVVDKTELALAAQGFLKQQLTELAGLIGAGQLDVLDLAADIPLFVGQEKEVIAVAAN